MNKLLLTKLLCLFSLLGYSGGDYFISGGRQAGMGNASITLSDAYALQYNQAGLGFLNRPELAFSFENRFLVAGINQMALFYAHPTKSGTFGISINYFGYNLYNENKFGLAYARAFGNKVSIGVQFDYLRLHISEIGSKNIFTFETGIQYKPLEKISFGFHIYNPVAYKIENTFGERIPSIIKMGMGYHPSEKVNVIAEVDMNVQQQPNIKFGFEYIALKQAQIRGGINTNPVSVHLGFGSHFKNLGVDIAGAYNAQLGLIPSCSLKYIISAKRKDE